MFMLSSLNRRCLNKCSYIYKSSIIDFSGMPDLSSLKILRTVEKKIDNDTSIFIDSPIHIKIQPIDVNDPIAHNTLVMQLYGRGGGDTNTDHFTVKQTAKRLELINSSSTSDCYDVCLVRLPHQLRVHVNASENASVHISNLEGEEFLVKAQRGSVRVADLKAQTVRAESAEGEVTTEGRLQAGDIQLKSGLASGIQCNNIMAGRFSATTHAGAITVRSCYSNDSHFTTALGDLHLNHLHRSVVVDVIQKGDLHLTSFDGKLQAFLKSGNVFLHASQLTDKSSIFIHEKGKVEFIFPRLLDKLPSINLIADKLSIDENIKCLGRLMDDSHPQRFRFPNEAAEDVPHELHIECRNGSVVLKQTNTTLVQ